VVDEQPLVENQLPLVLDFQVQQYPPFAPVFEEDLDQLVNPQRRTLSSAITASVLADAQFAFNPGADLLQLLRQKLVRATPIKQLINLRKEEGQKVWEEPFDRNLPRTVVSGLPSLFG
jgi:hypothetical protein